jgi:hypothetical protein
MESGKKKSWFGRSKGPKTSATEKRKQRTLTTVPQNSDVPTAVEAKSEGQTPTGSTELYEGLADTLTPKAINRPEVLGTGTLFLNFNDSKADVVAKVDSRAQQELQKAIVEFKEHYDDFVRTNDFVILDAASFSEVIENADNLVNVQDSARYFGKEITKVLGISLEKGKSSDGKWLNVIGNFLTKLYPFTRLSLRLTSSIAEVDFLLPNPI